ncbi:hypothetical protein EYF80_015058 [Liparis tanakae]|uniref:Uncharacterized protein n=1 Tax=Liparis tanakae TaxID=230148 RepID=A0A4Z2IA32_9TELE|nr:hypothetical protein EYF80_015058 [Liparis tanakae]
MDDEVAEAEAAFILAQLPVKFGFGGGGGCGRQGITENQFQIRLPFGTKSDRHLARTGGVLRSRLKVRNKSNHQFTNELLGTCTGVHRESRKHANAGREVFDETFLEPRSENTKLMNPDPLANHVTAGGEVQAAEEESPPGLCSISTKPSEAFMFCESDGFGHHYRCRSAHGEPTRPAEIRERLRRLRRSVGKRSRLPPQTHGVAGVQRRGSKGGHSARGGVYSFCRTVRLKSTWRW